MHLPCLWPALAAILLTGCASEGLRLQGESPEGKASKARELATTLPAPAESVDRRLVEYRDGLFLPRKTIPLSIERTLPGVFLKPDQYRLTLTYDKGRVNLSTLVERITKTTDIPVEINPNVYLRQAQVGGQANLAFDAERPISMDYQGPLSRYLDFVCTQLGISWEYANGRIHLYRWKSRTWEVKTLAGKKTMRGGFSSAGNIASSDKAGSSGSSNAMSQQEESLHDVWKELADQVAKIMGSGAAERLSVNQTLGTITATDTPQNLASIDQVMEDTNRRIGRQVYFKVEFYALTDKDTKQAGLDIAGILTANSDQLRLLSTPITSLATAAGGLAGAVLPASTSAVLPTLAAPGAVGDGVVNGMHSKFIFKAISEVATIADHRVYDARTLNNEPVSLTLATSESYVAEIGTSTSQTSTQNTLTQATVTTGTFLHLVPRIYDNNTVQVRFSLDQSTLEKFDITTVDKTTVKSPKVPRRAVSHHAMLRAGETLVLSQMMSDSDSGAGNLGISGGSRSRDRQRETLLILVTPVLTGSDS